MAKLLVIEDEDLIRGLLVEALASDGHVILEAEDGNIGLDKARNEQPDVIITDMSLPKATGWELVRAVREDPGTAQIPIIALSAHATAEDRAAAYDAGVNAYEEKPADIQRLKSKVSELLGD